MKKDGHLFFFFLFIFVTLIASLQTEEKNESVYKPVKIERIIIKNSDIVRVNYEIMYGSFYTGNQTYFLHKGIEVIEVKDLGTGYCGLPITGIFPVHSEITFDYLGHKAKLLISCDTDKPDGLLQIEGENVASMKVNVSKNSNNSISVDAVPM